MASNYNQILDSDAFTVLPDRDSQLSSGPAGFRLSGEPFGRLRGPGLRDYLKMAPMGRPGACVYEDVLLTALTPLNGPPGPKMGPIWGIEDSAALEYVLCWGKRVLAYAYRASLTREKAACLTAGLPPRLPVVDFPSHAKCQEELERACRLPALCALDTCGLSEAFRAIGLKEEAGQSCWQQLELLQSRRMVSPFHGELNEHNCQISPFGRQCGLLMRSTLGPDGRLRREIRVLLPAMDAFCQGVEYPRCRVLRVDDGGSLAQRLRRADSLIPSFFQYQKEVMPEAVERLREALTAPAGAEAGRALSRLGPPDMSCLEAVSRLGCRIETYGEYRDDPELSGAVRELAESLARREVPAPPGRAVLSLSQRLQREEDCASPLGLLTIAEYLQGLAILGKSSFVFWLYQHSLLPRTLNTLRLHPGSTLAELYRAAAGYYVESYQNDVFYALLVQPLAALAPNPERVPRLRRAA